MSYGQRTLPDTIDVLARDSAARVWARYPVSPEAFEQGKLVPVTFAILANAINRLAWYLDTILPGHDDLETICYIGPSDMLYFILACAACKCRLKTLFSSPKNDSDTHRSLLEKTRCLTLLGPQEKLPGRSLQHLAATCSVRYEALPLLGELLNPSSVDCFPWERSFDEVANEPFVVLHTSGSTGLPKAVSVSHGLVSTIDAQQILSTVDGRRLTAQEWDNRSVYLAMPPFHSAGINFFGFSVFQSTELVFGPSDKPPSLTTVEKILDMHAADAAVLPPSLLAEVAMDKVVFGKVSRWSNVTFGGAPLPTEAGDDLSRQTKVLQILGSTETFNLPDLTPRSADEWEYHCYHPHLGIEFRSVPGGLHELVVVRNENIARHQGAFWTFPDQNEYPMKDLYEQHPSKPGLWKYRGRLDDNIVLSNGEKFHPTEAERIIARDRTVKSALIVGAAREQPAVLVEPADIPDSDPKRTQVSVVQAVMQANEKLPAHAQIHASHIRVLESSDAFLRSSKGEIRRLPTTDALSDVIAEIYWAADHNSACSSRLDFRNEETLSRSLVQILSIDFFGGERLTECDNIFDRGLDSLRAVKLLRYIKAGLRDEGMELNSPLATRVIYQHPTALAMARMLLQCLEGKALGKDEAAASLDEMQRMLDAFTHRLNNLQKGKSSKATRTRKVVVLTGSSGSLGSYILDSLIRNSTVQKIICLNRKGGDSHKQLKTNRSRGLSTDFSRVEFLESNLAKQCLGLESEQYRKLVQETSHVIHNAWAVNFNLPLCSFELQLEACCRLVELALASPNRVVTTFLSSVGAANNWAHFHDGPVPEKILNDFRVSEAMGYAQSKQLAELLFAHASERYKIPVSVCRIGQIAGPVMSSQGAWNLKEWFPSVLLSCKALGKVPESLGAMDCMDWIPVDLLSGALVEAVLCDELSSSPGMMKRVLNALTASSSSPVTTLHFINPRKTYWQDVVHLLVDRSHSTVQVVPYAEWLKALVDAAEQENAAKDVPAVKLIGFFSSIGQPDAKRPEFSTSSAQERSVLLRDMSPVSLDWLTGWLHQWNIDGI